MLEVSSASLHGILDYYGYFFYIQINILEERHRESVKCTLSNINVITLQQLHRHILYKLLPPAARRLLRCPLLNVKLAQPAGEVHDCHCYDLWLPLKGQHCAEAGNTHTHTHTHTHLINCRRINDDTLNNFSAATSDYFYFD